MLATVWSDVTEPRSSDTAFDNIDANIEEVGDGDGR